MDIGAGRDQRDDLNAVAADLPHPVGDDLSGDDDLEGVLLGVLLIGLLDGWLISRLIRLVRLLISRWAVGGRGGGIVVAGTGDREGGRAQRDEQDAERPESGAGHGERGL